MNNCEVTKNCINYLNERGHCWHCNDYNYYVPENKKIRCKKQLEKIAKLKQTKKELKNSEASRRGKRAKKKGYEGEKEVVDLLNKFKIKAKRQILSGSLKGELGGDVVLFVNGEKQKIEVKRKKDGYKELYKYIEQDECDYVFCRADRKGWLVVQRFENWIKFIGG